VRVRFCDELEGVFGWVVDEFMERCSHALVTNGRVWLIDPLAADGVEERVRSAGEPAGVIQLIDRHNRDCAEVAERLGVPCHVVPLDPVGPFTFVSIRSGRTWKEVALWWPARRVLACGDALGTAPYYRSRADRLAVHPFLRLRPPRRQLQGLAPATILCGHGECVADGAAEALREALRTARWRIPGQFANAVRAWRENRD
jgi:hypothetical protein